MATRETAIHVMDTAGAFDDAGQDSTAAEVPIQAWIVPRTLADLSAVISAPSSALETATTFDVRDGRNLIDQDRERALLEWSDSDSDEKETADSEDEDNEYFDDIRVDDEDWEISERDFTKQYNRLKQHIAIRTGKEDAGGVSRSATNDSTRAHLPAINAPSSTTTRSKITQPSVKAPKARTEDQLQALAKYTARISKINDTYTRPQGLEGLSAGVNRKGPSATANQKDKSDRATNEQVLDPRTRLILFKMIGRELIHEVNGCVSTGKEANVYHALTPDKSHLALKIYKTSILTFKDRDRYVTGEYRFRRGYSKHNPRKMVRVWAEKEMRNLKRLVAAGINCPEPIEVRENVLVMKFLGDADGWASPRLKDADLPPEDVDHLYESMLLTTRAMFHACKLVHADLSEYNVLYHERSLWIIDVSQSVEHDHPSAFDFLRKDLTNIDDFFRTRAGVSRTLGLRLSFDFVTKEMAEGVDALAALRRMREELTEDDTMDNDAATHEDEVFKRAFIPRTLDQVFDPERDAQKLNRGEGDSLIYTTVIGVQPSGGRSSATEPPKSATDRPKGVVHFEDGRDASGDELETASGSDDEEAGGEKPFVERQSRGHRHEDRDAKKERKKAVKEENREKRKNKMPKAEKKKRVQATKAGR